MIKSWKVSVLAATLLGSCLLTTAAQAADAVNVRFSWKLKGEYAGFYVAKEQGLFADQGLDVHLGEGAGSSAALSGLVQGEEDLVVMPGVFALSAISQGMPVKIVALYHPAAPLGILSFPDNPVRTPADLEGKSLPTSPGDTVTSYLPVFCKINQIDCGKIKLVSLNTDARTSMFMTKRIDAIGSYLNVDAPILDSMVKTPFVRLDLAKYGLVLPGLAVVASDKVIADKPGMVTRFLSALNQGTEVAIRDPQEAAKDISKDWAAPPKPAILVAQIKATTAAIPVTEGKPMGYVQEAALTQALTLLSGADSDMKVLPVADYYTNALLP
ncbi:ABC transporter substrate-binding protein [Pseudooceanicola sp. CBS1P-1]|uniref:SsuA/THI5-like domain-containing protein n=1 Tax=Pseudooceanicola albus TaxID=2692189 RepID=A0A6L7G3K0_9RHOB|nr:MULTISPECIES: ABC transporter substrate-binding protein [Pseudooceanicola]MBT9385231.1 ABC transporter substrate-binding protein [Pseudooceanicola endophyticus]MXN18685.1 hypothetical protein [Pseudooceanicola albus]